MLGTRRTELVLDPGIKMNADKRDPETLAKSIGSLIIKSYNLVSSFWLTCSAYLGLGAEPEIDQLEMTVLVYQNILRLQVPMGVALRNIN